jgi:non-ribosomal peptide synthetase component E (peptide arylation enzyme)
MEINHKMPEGLSKYYTETTGWWGEMIDRMTQEERQSLMQSLIDNEPRYSERELQQEIEKAREEGREEGINAVLFPKFKRDKNGTLKREGWVNTSKLKDNK